MTTTTQDTDPPDWIQPETTTYHEPFRKKMGGTETFEEAAGIGWCCWTCEAGDIGYATWTEAQNDADNHTCQATA